MAPPPGPVKIGHKKDGRQRWPHRFHVSRPPPLPGRWIRYCTVIRQWPLIKASKKYFIFSNYGYEENHSNIKIRQEPMIPIICSINNMISDQRPNLVPERLDSRAFPVDMQNSFYSLLTKRTHWGCIRLKYCKINISVVTSVNERSSKVLQEWIIYSFVSGTYGWSVYVNLKIHCPLNYCQIINTELLRNQVIITFLNCGSTI